MRILHVNVGYPPFLGGSQLYLQRIARGLVERGHDVEVWTSAAAEVEALWDPSKPMLPAGAELDGRVRVRRFPLRHLPFSRYAYHGLRRVMLELSERHLSATWLLWRLAQFTPWLPEIDRALQADAPDVDLVHGWNIPFESLLGPALEFARRRGVPFVATPLVHLGEAEDAIVRRQYTMRHQMALIQDSDAVIALTEMEAGHLAEQGVRADRLHVIGGGVDAEAIGQGNAARFRARYGLVAPFVLFVGALNPHKGAIHLLQAMVELWERGIQADLVMIGQPMREFGRFYAEAAGRWKARCHLLGTVSEADKADALAACELLALPSRTESFGLVYLEAWAAGKPVIGAKAGAVPAVVDDGQDGLLVPFGQVGALAEAIVALLNDPDRGAAMGRAGRQKALACYSWEAAVAKTVAVYQKVLGA